jgi:hypothetical protein
METPSLLPPAAAAAAAVVVDGIVADVDNDVAVKSTAS